MLWSEAKKIISDSTSARVVERVSFTKRIFFPTAYYSETMANGQSRENGAGQNQISYPAIITDIVV